MLSVKGIIFLEERQKWDMRTLTFIENILWEVFRLVNILKKFLKFLGQEGFFCVCLYEDYKYSTLLDKGSFTCNTRTL